MAGGRAASWIQLCTCAGRFSVVTLQQSVNLLAMDSRRDGSPFAEASSEMSGCHSTEANKGLLRLAKLAFVLMDNGPLASELGSRGRTHNQRTFGELLFSNPGRHEGYAKSKFGKLLHNFKAWYLDVRRQTHTVAKKKVFSHSKRDAVPLVEKKMLFFQICGGDRVLFSPGMQRGK
jgi:hypothetical protein